MQGLWYGDRRDRVKWGALAYLAGRFKIASIVQIAYLRKSQADRLSTDEGARELNRAVSEHFANLKGVELLGPRLDVEITVFDEKFDGTQRQAYMTKALKFASKATRPRLLFLDPDTGIEPEVLKAEHAALRDLELVWSDLEAGEILAVYQHAARRKGWLYQCRRRFATACKDVCHIVGSDARNVAILWSKKGQRKRGRSLCGRVESATQPRRKG